MCCEFQEIIQRAALGRLANWRTKYVSLSSIASAAGILVTFVSARRIYILEYGPVALLVAMW